ncbi:hypothetical protein FEM48_Zijuj08G0010300 [Ziziphus jujuba var. spinosa]|uniref:Uncharacterized protein n=1 Tax=Ziziphus jujuba var. spinosa TaxID=714518 RepID=A0A978UW32_ZIZJJ|nr:hypothetical protein FEM48_Zijuj08G0010300 [Ziziphus jujuba var. spinosa]
MAETLPPPFAPKESLTKRYKLVWRVLLISNFALGGYLFARARKKDRDIATRRASETGSKDAKAAEEVHPPPITTPPISEILALLPPVMEPRKLRKPILEDQQRQLFEWMLEEKRKVVAKDREEKKQIDEDKAILKQFIRAKSVPRF